MRIHRVALRAAAVSLSSLRSVRRAVGLGAALALLGVMLPAMPHAAAAQPSVGALAGAEFDNKSHWFLYGIEARVPFTSANGGRAELQPRVTFHSFGGGSSVLQIDANLMSDWQLANPGTLAPYSGIGGAYLRTKSGGVTRSRAGLNIVSGAKFVLEDNLLVVPFVHTQYTIVRDYPNSFTLTLGLSINLGGPPTR